MILSKNIENAIEEFSKLPGVGKKTALRYVLNLLEKDHKRAETLSKSILDLTNNTKICTQCNAVNDNDICYICDSNNRDSNQICIVEKLKDLIAVESTNQFKGKYFILGGVISPIEGIGIKDLYIDKLIEKVLKENTKELIMALNPSIEGDTTIFYISNKLKDKNIKITAISRGIAFGGELDYTDSITLGRSLLSRQPMESLIKK